MYAYGKWKMSEDNQMHMFARLTFWSALMQQFATGSMQPDCQLLHEPDRWTDVCLWKVEDFWGQPDVP